MQFVAAPSRSGYSVEAQLTGRDAVAGIQFDHACFGSGGERVHVYSTSRAIARAYYADVRQDV